MSTPTRDDFRTLPHDLDAEKCTLGGLLLAGGHLVDKVAQILTPADFYRPAHQIIYEAILDLNRRGEPVDAITVDAKLRATGQSEKTGNGGYLIELSNFVPTPANTTYYARLVKDKARMRNLVLVGTRIAEFGYSGSPEDLDDMVHRAHQALTDVDTADGDAPTVDRVAWEVMEWLEKGDGDERRVRLPYRDLNDLIGGLKPGQMVIIGARPAVGKSLVALDIARHAAFRQDLPVYFASLEMDRREIMLRIFAAEARVNLKRLQDRSVDDNELLRVLDVANRVSDPERPRLIIDDTPNVTVNRLRAELRKMERRNTGPARLVVVDYLQLMRTPEGRRSPENRQLEVSELSRNLKLLAREFEVPIVALSQLSRAVEQRVDKRPQLSDLRESGSLEQDADIVMLLHRDDEAHPGEMHITVAKHRNGPTGSVAVAFQGHYARAVDMAR